jgi:hypothetical protein
LRLYENSFIRDNGTHDKGPLHTHMTNLYTQTVETLAKCKVTFAGRKVVLAINLSRKILLKSSFMYQNSQNEETTLEMRKATVRTQRFRASNTQNICKLHCRRQYPINRQDP